jgi:hypothetical protein
VWTIAPGVVVAWAKASSDGAELSGSSCRRSRPEPRPDLDRDADERLLAALAAPFEAFFVAAEEELVDLYLVLELLALGRDHRSAQLVQDQPGGLVTRQAELTLQLLGGDPGVMGGDQVRRPEPRAQRCAGAVHDRARRHRRLVPTRRADPQMPTRLAAAPTAAARRTHEPFRPA